MLCPRRERRRGRKGHERNRVISKTLGKNLFIVDQFYDRLRLPPTLPDHWQAFWRVRVIAETNIGAKGCFLAIPIVEVDRADIRVLLPGYYAEEDYRGVSIVRPVEQPSLPWMLPTDMRHEMAVRERPPHAILVRLDGGDE